MSIRSALYCVHVFRADGTLRNPPIQVTHLNVEAIGMRLVRWERGRGSQLATWVARSVLGNGHAKAHRAEDKCPRSWSCSTMEELRAASNGHGLESRRLRV